jgi:hypothetical protein
MLSHGDLTPSAQRDFYAAFSSLAAAVAPVTVASLRASLDAYGVEVRQYLFFGRKERISLAKRATMHRQIQALIAFGLLLLFQASWFTASSLLGSLPKPPADEAKLLERSLLRSGKIVSEPTGGPSPSPSPTSTTPSQSEIQQGGLADGLNAQVEYVLWTIQRSATVERLDLLNGFVDPMHFIARAKEPKIPSPSQIDEVPVKLVAWQDSVILRAKYVNDLFQQLFLPPLYGCVGALAYILRTLSQQAKDRLYRTENDTVWDLRISLGILAGLAIGWFLKPSGVEAATGIGLVSPLALAFVAGYSVDLLFTAMDRIVAAFSGPDRVPEAPRRPAAQGQPLPGAQEQPAPPAQEQPKPPAREQPQN